MRDRDRRRVKKLWGKRTAEAIAADLGVTAAEVFREARRQRLPQPSAAPPLSVPLPPGRPVWGWLVLLSLALFANNLPNAFVYDDKPAVVDNPAARDLSQTRRIFTTASWWPPDTDARHYRPLTTFTYAANGSLTGASPAGYHLVNNLLHGLAAGVLHAVLIRSGASQAAALLTSVVFVVHPLHVEAVSWVNGRADVLAGLCLLAALLAHIRARQEGSVRWRVAAVLAFLAAGLSKETGYLTPFVLFAWDLMIGSSGRWPERVRQSISTCWAEYLGHAVVLIFFAIVRAKLVGGATVATVTPMASPLGDANFAERLATGSYVIARYLGLTVWPGPLSVDYSPDQITRLSTLFDPRTLLGMVTVAAYCAALVVTCRRARRVAFGLALAAIVMAPAANILFPIGTIMADRLMYLPLLAVAIPVGEGWARLYDGGQRRVALGLAAVLVVALGARTVVRNLDWRTEESLYRSALEASPRSAMAHKNLAAILQERGQNDVAADLARQAIAIVEPFPDAWLTLGNAYVGLGRYQDAVAAYRRTLELRTDHASAYTNLAAALFFLGDAQGAVQACETGLQLDPEQASGWYNRVHFLAGAGRPLDAEQALQQAVARYPDYTARGEAEAKVRQAMQGSLAKP